MNQELLLRIEIPHAIQIGKSSRKLWTNYIMNMHYQKYGRLHQQWKSIVLPILKQAYQEKAWGHRTADIYQVSLGFLRGKSTKRCDADGMSILGKWAIDALVECTSIPDDDIYHIDEFRCIFLGPSTDGKEHVFLQVTRTRKYNEMA